MASYSPSSFEPELDVTNSDEWPELVSLGERHVEETYPGEHMRIKVVRFDSVMKAFALTLKQNCENESTLKKSSTEKCLRRSHRLTYQRQNEVVPVVTNASHRITYQRQNVLLPVVTNNVSKVPQSLGKTKMSKPCIESIKPSNIYAAFEDPLLEAEFEIHLNY